MNDSINDYGIYKMVLGDAVDANGVKVIRVPGGWIWQLSRDSGVFVAFHNEFQRVPVRDDDDI